ncbi:MAG: hypothetical protein OHK93_005792 [Ramalina farinacea]|uniref:TLC domain-containing protein n=1 Tax=Ramalina farinacea TaxID=258253 RepID=A0AA43QHB8_9LECA|nr:hypothetical protein [Ramalina farinacea]
MPLPSQLTLLFSTLTYPALLRLLSGPSPTPAHFSASIKHISTLHSTLVTTLALSILKDAPWRHHRNHSPDPLITARSDFANAITAIEAGYLLQDSVALVKEAQLRGGGISRNVDKTLLVHHVGIGAALLVLHYYIARGKERGIYIIVMFLLMNASTPLLNLRWYLRTFARHRRKAIFAADAAFVAAFFVARVYLVWRILGEYGRYHEWGVWDTFWKGLRVPCQMGTGALFVANLGWWVIMCQNLARGGKRFTFGGQ